MKKIITLTLFFILCLTQTVFAFETTDLVNADNPLPENFLPNKLETVEIFPTSKLIKVEEQILTPLNDMYEKMKEDNVSNVFITSGYRSYDYQTILFKNKIQEYVNNGYIETEAENIAKTIVAIPGTSEHQTGLAIDLSIDGSLEENFENSNVFKWLNNNAHKYGFILRYPKNKTELTKIIYEPWHYRYVGIELATYLYENKICLEEYYNPIYRVNSKLFDTLSKIE